MKKRIAALFLAFALLTAVIPVGGMAALAADTWDGTATASPAGGSGTASDPYRITGAGQLAFVAEQVNAGKPDYMGAHYRLTTDIDLAGRAWTPIGASEQYAFHGSFDGDGHTVSGLAVGVSQSGSGYAGLFGCVSGNGVISDLTVKGTVTLSVTGGASATAFAGGIAGRSDAMTLASCTFEGLVSVTCAGGTAYVGGISGSARYDVALFENCKHTGGCVVSAGTVMGGGIVGSTEGVVSGCANEASFEVSGAQNARVGGVVGSISGSGSSPRLYNCMNAAQVKVNAPSGALNAYVGGLVGGSSGAFICNSYSVGQLVYADVAPNSARLCRIGGICGLLDGDMSNCLARGVITAPSGTVTGGLSGEESAAANTSACYYLAANGLEPSGSPAGRLGSVGTFADGRGIVAMQDGTDGGKNPDRIYGGTESLTDALNRWADDHSKNGVKLLGWHSSDSVDGGYPRFGTPTVSAELNPTEAEFDTNEKSALHRDVVLAQSLNGNALNGIYCLGVRLTAGVDYIASGSAVILKTDLLTALGKGDFEFIFDYSAGVDRVVTVRIKSTAAKDGAPRISPAIAAFDLNTASASHAAVTVTRTDGGAKLLGILCGEKKLTEGKDYTLSGSSVTFPVAYLSTLPEGRSVFTFDYEGIDADPSLLLSVADSTPFSGGNTISPAAVRFDRSPASADNRDIVVTQSAVSALTGVRCGGRVMFAGVDYVVDGNKITIRKSFLGTLPVGMVQLTFEYGEGGSPALGLTVFDSSAGVDAELVRMGGSDRIATAAAVSREGWTAADTAVLANAYSFADALAGTPLAGVLGAPVLLTGKDALDARTAAELTRLGAKTVYILGGSAVVGGKVETQLRDLGIKTVRMGGSDRYATAAAVAAELNKLRGGSTGTVYLVSGENFPDALAVSPVAAIQGSPILFLPAKGAAKATTDFIRTSSAKTAYVIGGTGAVSKSSEDSVRALGLNVTRVGGADRYETALKINREFVSVFTGSGVAAATGKDFPDALAGASFAARNGVPLVLVGAKSDAPTAEWVQLRRPAKLFVLGGTSAVSDAAAKALLGE